MKQPLRHYARALVEALHEKDVKEDIVLKNFVRLLSRDGVLKNVDAIVRLFVNAWNARTGERDVRMITAHPIPQALQTSLAREFEETLAVKHVSLTMTEDSSLLGGAILAWDDVRLDGSVKRQLGEMEKTFQR